MREREADRLEQQHKQRGIVVDDLQERRERKMATADSPITNSDSDSEFETISNPNPIPNSTSTPSSDALVSNPSSPPLVCLLRFAGDSAAGAVMGSIFG